jgi:hypothetical protein
VYVLAVGLCRCDVFAIEGYTHAPSGQSLAGTLKAAKRRKLVTYGPELLLQGTSDKEIIRMLKAE